MQKGRGEEENKEIFRMFETSEGGNFEPRLIESLGKTLLECRHRRRKEREHSHQRHHSQLIARSFQGFILITAHTHCFLFIATAS